ncbi:uncharacterized protein DS421_5g139930 [Arachis hypogaea]|nr:uncharacterized protein DS421_5g139930 [Arachis hypogaea]
MLGMKSVPPICGWSNFILIGVYQSDPPIWVCSGRFLRFALSQHKKRMVVSQKPYFFLVR